jgi:hypothetical protein
MTQIVSTLAAARAPPSQAVVVLARTPYNATGPERIAAATKLQQIYRGKRARRKFKEFLQTVYEWYVDDDSGCVYYVNTYTHASSWEKPALLHRIDAVQGSDVMRVKKKPEKPRLPQEDAWTPVQDESGYEVRHSMMSRASSGIPWCLVVA